MAGVAMHHRMPEEGGEQYGEERVKRVQARVSELRGDTVAGGEISDDQ